MNISLKSKMALAVSLLFILFSLGMTWFTLSFFQNRFEADLTGQQVTLAASLAQSIDNKLEMARTAMNGATAKVTPEIVSSPRKSQQYLDSRPTLQAIFDDGIYLFNVDGRFIAESSYIHPHTQEELRRLEQACGQTAASGKAHISSYTFLNGRQGVFFSIPVKDGSGEMYAIMAGGIDLQGKGFACEISRIRIGKTGYLYIYDADRNSIVHQNRTEDLRNLPQGAEVLLKKASSYGSGGSGITVDPSQGSMITSYKRMDSTDWFVVANLPRTEAYAPLLDARKYFLIATVTGTVIHLMLVWFLMRRLMAPLQQMIRHITGVSNRPVEERFCSIDSHDEIGRLATVFNDMVADLNSRQKSLEETAVRAENEKARSEAIIAALGEGLSIQDRDFRIIYQNRIHQEIKGNCQGRLCHEAYEGKETACDNCPVAMVFSDGKLHSVEKEVVLRGEPANVELVASPLRDATGEIVAAIEIARNITSRKRAEEEIRELNSHLQKKAAELELANGELKAFGYSLSHDLKTPLNRISLAAQLLEELYGEKLDESGRFCIESIGAGSKRMDEMIDGMLLLSGISRSDLIIKEVDLSGTAEEIAHRLQAESPERTVVWSIEPAAVVSGDPRLLKSVLENLLGNAWKYTGKTADACIEFGTVPYEGETAYFVRDNGAGFDQLSAEKIFRPFQRLHGEEDFKGSGIGLATVQRIIHRHGGKIWAEGQRGKGATFYFTVPPAG